MPELDLKSIGLTHWWQALVAAGLAIMVASVTVKFVPTILIGLGVLLFGIGEWRNHQLQTRIDGGFKITGYPRSQNIFGLACDVAGLILVGLGIWKLVLI